MARKLPRLQRRLSAPDLFSVAYGEIASSIYFALGIIALHALGFTPEVLLATGALFLIVALSYAEGTTELRETGGAATFVRRAFNDLAGFIAGWALFLDYLIVTALAALFLPHYLGRALGFQSLERGPWDKVAALAVIAAIAAARRPGVQLPKSLFGGIGAVVAVYVGIAVVGLMAFPVHGGTTQLGERWQGAPLMGIVAALDPHIAGWAQTPLRVFVGLSGALILLLAASTSVSGFGRLAYSLGEHGQLPRAFGRLHRRMLVAPESVLAATGISAVIILLTSLLHRPVTFLASLFSFGVLLAFTAAQLAVIRLRFLEPTRRRPFKVPLNVRVRGGELPIPAVVGALLTFAIWIDAIATHPAARYAGPAWLVAGLVVYVSVRRSRGAGLLGHVVSTDEQVVPEATFSSILVPMKLGEIGEEMVATAIKLAQERGSRVEALHVIR